MIRPCVLILCVAASRAHEGDDGPTRPLPPPAARVVDSARDAAPILSKSCYRCHGPKKQEGGLALHVPDRTLAGVDPSVLAA